MWNQESLRVGVTRLISPISRHFRMELFVEEVGRSSTLQGGDRRRGREVGLEGRLQDKVLVSKFRRDDTHQAFI